MARGIVVASALLLALAGCVQSDGPAGTTAPTSATKSAETGGIQGHILTDEIQPIMSAQVALADRDDVAVTGDDGAFAFSLLPPGEYTVLANALGYFSANKRVTVVAGEIEGADIIMDRIPVSAPNFTETFKFEDTLLVSDTCPEAPEMTEGAQGVTWQDYPLRINDSKPDGTPLAATRVNVDLRSQEDAATVDVDLYFLDSTGKQLSSGTSETPNENLTYKKVLPAGDYTVRACLWAGANAHYKITVAVTYEQGESALYAREKGRK